MNPATPGEKAPLRKKLHLALAIVAGLAVLLGAVLKGVEWSRWRAMGREVDRFVAESATRNGARPVAWGEAEPGNAWDEYLLGLEDLSNSPIKTPGNLRAFAGKGGGADRAQVLAELQAHEKALEHLTRGAHRAEWRVPLQWEAESILPYAGEGLLRKLGELSICRIRMLREQGDSRAALAALLETAQYARDLAANTIGEYEWEGLEVLELVLIELEELAVSRRLKEPDLDALERGLRTLDSTLARDGGPLLNDVACFGRFLQREDPYLEADGTYIKRRPLSPGWRFWFSMTLFKTDAFRRWQEAATVHAAGGREPWSVAKRIYAKNAALLESPPENLAVNRVTAPSLETNRLRETRLALVLVAVHFQRTGQVEAHADPFAAGGPLKIRSDERSLRAWSVGPNGTDDEGSSPDRPRNTTGSTTIIGPALDAADDLAITVER